MIISQIRDLVKHVMPDDFVHGYPHVERVRKLALEIAEEIEEPVDKEVLEIAALLHDIGRYGSSGKHHAEASAEIADFLLFLLQYPEDKRKNVVEAIRAHSYSLNTEAVSLEAKILSDADKLDALGAIGIGRVFMYSCQHSRSLEDTVKHMKEKLLRLQSLMYTSPGRRMARNRTEIMENFLRNLEKELSTPST